VGGRLHNLSLLIWIGLSRHIQFSSIHGYFSLPDWKHDRTDILCAGEHSLSPHPNNFTISKTDRSVKK
jgi:hypothetical protein